MTEVVLSFVSFCMCSGGAGQRSALDCQREGMGRGRLRVSDAKARQQHALPICRAAQRLGLWSWQLASIS